MLSPEPWSDAIPEKRWPRGSLAALVHWRRFSCGASREGPAVEGFAPPGKKRFLPGACSRQPLHPGQQRGFASRCVVAGRCVWLQPHVHPEREAAPEVDDVEQLLLVAAM